MRKHHSVAGVMGMIRTGEGGLSALESASVGGGEDTGEDDGGECEAHGCLV